MNPARAGLAPVKAAPWFTLVGRERTIAEHLPALIGEFANVRRKGDSLRDRADWRQWQLVTALLGDTVDSLDELHEQAASGLTRPIPAPRVRDRRRPARP